MRSSLSWVLDAAPKAAQKRQPTLLYDEYSNRVRCSVAYEHKPETKEGKSAAGKKAAGKTSDP